MRKTKSLIRAAMTEGMRMFSYRAKDEKSKKVLPVVLAGIAFLAIFSYAQTMTWSLKEAGLQHAVLAAFIVFTAVLTLIEGVYKASGLLFNCRDNDLLMALPLKKTEIVGIRILKFYAFEVLYNALFLAPAILAYMLNAEWGVGFVVAVVMMILVLPVLPITLACIIGAVTTVLATKFKKQNAAQTILTLIFLTAIIVLSFEAGQLIDGFGDVAEALNAKITELYYPARAVINYMVLDFNIVECAKFLAIHVAVAVGLVALMGRFYFDIVSRANGGNVTRKTKALGFKQHTPTVAIIKKELNRYFNTPVLVSNTCMGLILFIIAIIAVTVKSEDLIATLVAEDFPMSAEEVRAYLPTVNMVCVMFAGLMTFITTTMISLEGKAFDMLKTLPVSGRRVILAKILTAMMIILPFLLVGDLVMFVKFRFSVIEMLLVLAATVIVPLVTETVGILIDLKFARFDAESDAEVVKQSTGVLVASFFGLGMTIVTISLCVAMVALLGQTTGMMATNGMFLVIEAGLWWKLQKDGEKKYRKLSA
ncbi:hypothetical protein IJI17_03280 [Candidatus Saccharibacteria bacterium]|nr:hypothetical protein [Candidatus Saccharibacteria bacterium]